jgi:hypothetical protein
VHHQLGNPALITSCIGPAGRLTFQFPSQPRQGA